MATLELVLRLIGLALLTLLTAIVLRAKPLDLKALCVVGLTTSVGCFLLTSMRGADALFGAAIYPMSALCATHPVWFWLASKALFSDIKALLGVHVASLVGIATLGVIYQSLLTPSSGLALDPRTYILGVAFGLASLTFACLAPLSVLVGFEGDLDLRRRRIRSWFTPIVSFYLALAAVTQIVALLRGEPVSRVLVVLNLAVIVLVCLLAAITFVRVRVVNWLDVIEPPAPPLNLSRVEHNVLRRLERFAADRMYARTSLTIGELARDLGTQEHVLRRVIHRGLGFQNFNDFLHAHRLREAAQRLRRPDEHRIPVLTIALDVGYGSIGPFNRAFKERFGMTPTEYRRAPQDEADLRFEEFESLRPRQST